MPLLSRRRRSVPPPSPQRRDTRGVYAGFAELARRHTGADAAPGHAGDLTPYEYRVFSQNGEDGVLAELLRRAGARRRNFVEFGVGRGVQGNCVVLADVLGWSGLFLEADKDAFESLRRKYETNDGVRTVRARVTAENVEQLFLDGGVAAEPDVLSIDVDGNDYWIWERIERFRPRLVVIEYNSSLGSRRKLVQRYDAEAAWTGTDHFGASIAALTALAERKGYRLAHTELAGVNAFFVRADLAIQLPPSVPLRAPNFELAAVRLPPTRREGSFVDLDAT